MRSLKDNVYATASSRNQGTQGLRSVRNRDDPSNERLPLISTNRTLIYGQTPKNEGKSEIYYKSNQPYEPLINKLIMPEISCRITPLRQNSTSNNPVILRDYLNRPSPINFNRLFKDQSVKKINSI